MLPKDVLISITFSVCSTGVPVVEVVEVAEVVVATCSSVLLSSFLQAAIMMEQAMMDKNNFFIDMGLIKYNILSNQTGYAACSLFL